jgi:hypothetical protein
MTTRFSGCTRVLVVLFVSILTGAAMLLPASAYAACGDGILDAGEQCDGGECCSATCHYLALGSPCTDDGEVCTRDVCNGAGACVHDGSPLDSCLIAPKGKLQIANDADDSKDKLILQMQNAPGISPADFGDPIGTDTYHACIFGPDGLLMQAEVGPGGNCGMKPCWAETTTGFTYKDNSGSRDGITALTLKASAKPKTKITAHGQGAQLDDAPLPFPDAVMAQIVNGKTGQCFETYFLEPSAVKKNTPTVYDSKSAAPGFELPGLATVVRQDDLAPGTPSASFANERGVAPPSGPDPTKVYVQSITYDGTGCPAGSVGQSFTSDLTGFQLTFSQFVASKGPGVAASEATKTCQLNLNLKVPQGWQYSIGTIDYRGSVSLPKKMKATQQATYYFDGDGELASADSSFVGLKNEQYLIRDTLPFSTVVWSSCDKVRPLTITTQLQLKGGTEPGQISNDTVDGKVAFVLALHWKPCP